MSETLSALKFAQRAKMVKVMAVRWCIWGLCCAVLCCFSPWSNWRLLGNLGCIFAFLGWSWQVVNEDMTGTVSQLQAELKAMRGKLMEANGACSVHHSATLR